jgi:acetamidase/formamidase
MQRRDFFSSRFHYTFGDHPPQLRIKPDTSLRVICPDSDNELSDGTLLSADQRQQDASSPLFEGNPMAGPIYVEGAVPGDCLAVRIDAIHLDRQKGQTGLAYAHGLLPPDLLIDRPASEAGQQIPHHLFEWKIEPAKGTATVVNPLGNHPITVPLNPFVGCIGVCPKWGQSISTLDCGPHGGNMDVPLTRSGSTLYLPVFRDGALLMMGDLHAAQGHGEIIGGGIETSGQIDCTIQLLKSHPIPAPRITDEQSLSALGVAGELRQAIQQAYAHLLNWLVHESQLNRWDAYNLISQAASLMTGGLNSPPFAAAASIPLAVIPTKSPASTNQPPRLL